ncbi:MAG: hypothetical protein ACYDEY_14225 [Acidimicrobiales bacterium]
MNELRAALGTQVNLTVFRKLAELEHRTSHPHRGAFYTLDEITRFGALGLWSFRAVYFSEVGTLVVTAEALVATAEAGYDAVELATLVHVDVGHLLLALVRDGLLARERLAGRYVYLSPQERRAAPSWQPARSTTRRPAVFPSASPQYRLVGVLAW